MRAQGKAFKNIGIKDPLLKGWGSEVPGPNREYEQIGNYEYYGTAEIR